MDKVLGDAVFSQMCNPKPAKSVTTALQLIEVFPDRVQRTPKNVGLQQRFTGS
jgi:hypothetical protein